MCSFIGYFEEGFVPNEVNWAIRYIPSIKSCVSKMGRNSRYTGEQVEVHVQRTFVSILALLFQTLLLGNLNNPNDDSNVTSCVGKLISVQENPQKMKFFSGFLEHCTVGFVNRLSSSHKGNRLVQGMINAHKGRVLNSNPHTYVIGLLFINCANKGGIWRVE